MICVFYIAERILLFLIMEKLKQFGRFSVRIFNKSKAKEETGDFNFVTNIKEDKFSIIWRIENVHRCTLNCREFLESPPFSTRSHSEVKWTLRFYPRGRKTEDFGGKKCNAHNNRDKSCEMGGLFLYKMSEKPVTSTFRSCFSYKRALLSNSIYTYNEECSQVIKMDSKYSSEFGVDNFFCTESLETPQALIVKCDIYVINTLNREAPGNHMKGIFKSDTLFDDLKTMYESGVFSDVTIQAGDVKFHAHKAVLATRSEVFAAMFRHDMKENQTNIIQVFDEPAVLNNLLQYIYTGSIDDFNIEKAISLYSVANKYLLEELKNWCIDIMLANLKVENVCEIAVLADLHPDRKLKEAIFSMFRNYTSDIFKRKEWQNLIRDAERNALVSNILQAISADIATTKCSDVS